MSLIERIGDSFTAFILKGCPVSIHTVDGDVGKIESTNIQKGKITVRLNNTGLKIIEGRKVAPLDDFLK